MLDLRRGMSRLPAGPLALAVCLLAGAAILWLFRPSAPVEAAKPTADAEAVTVAVRPLVRIVRLTGLTEATRSHVVTVPLLAGATRSSLTITRLAASGTVVKAGDLLVEFDPQNQQKTALEKRVEYQDLVEQIAKKRAEHLAARVKDESELEQAANAVKKYELEVLKNEMLARIKAEENTQKLDESRATLVALRANAARKREAAAAEVRILEIRRDRARAAMEYAERNVEAMTVRSPLDGIVVIKARWRGNGIGDVQEGDELWPGAPVLEVVNQASMQVRAKINQADLPYVEAGQPVTVRLDAYPDLALPGRIAQVAPIALAGAFSSRVRTFTALATVEASNVRVLPDLTAALDVEVERVTGLVVPRDALRTNGDGARIRVRQGDASVERQVTLGPHTEVEAIVSTGLEPGMVVLRHWQ
jgi:HlyD family secretion protein